MRQKEANMAKCRKVKSRLAAVVLVFMAGAALLFVFTVKYDQGKEEDCFDRKRKRYYPIFDS